MKNRTSLGFLMRTIFTIIFTMIIGPLLCQPGYESQFASCEEAVKQADIDAEAGILTSVSWGLRPLEDFEGDAFRQNLMLAKYGIESIGFGCVIPMNLDCYGNQMHEIILAKFGSDFFEKIEKEYDVFKSLDQNQRKQYINFDLVYKFVDNRATYAKGYGDLYREIHKRVSLSDPKASRYAVIELRLVVGQAGTIEECKVLSTGFSKTQVDGVENAMRALGGWIPATLYGFNVKSEVIVTIPLRLE